MVEDRSARTPARDTRPLEGARSALFLECPPLCRPASFPSSTIFRPSVHAQRTDHRVDQFLTRVKTIHAIIEKY